MGYPAIERSGPESRHSRKRLFFPRKISNLLNLFKKLKNKKISNILSFLYDLLDYELKESTSSVFRIIFFKI